MSEGKVVKSYNLPCKVGDTIYVIPSKVNFKLNKVNRDPQNNRVYEQVVERIELYRNGVYLAVTCNGLRSAHGEFFGENWFMNRQEAERKLAAMEGETNE
jgi:hypothetical protein